MRPVRENRSRFSGNCSAGRSGKRCVVTHAIENFEQDPRADLVAGIEFEELQRRVPALFQKAESHLETSQALQREEKEARQRIVVTSEFGVRGADPAPVRGQTIVPGGFIEAFLGDGQGLRQLALVEIETIEPDENGDMTGRQRLGASEMARRDFVNWRLSVGGRGRGFSLTLHRVRRGMADVVSGYLSAIDEQLPAIIERLRSVQILSRDASEVIQKWDSPETLIYCDPPYVHETRSPTSRDLYGVELSAAAHRQLASVLHACKSKVVLSGYDSPLYNELYGTWRTQRIEISNHAASGASKARMHEVLWMNW